MVKKSGVQPFVVDLPEELHQELRTLSFHTKRPMKDYAAEWIARGLGAEQKKANKVSAA